MIMPAHRFISHADVAHHLIDLIFNHLLPKYGMMIRDAQVELAHRLLDILIGHQVALHEAGVGIGVDLLLSGSTISADFVVRAVEEAVRNHGRPEIINSDQCSQFTAKTYIDCIKGYETIKISMDGKGRVTDNS